MVYKEIGGDIVHFLKLYRLLKKERINPQHIVSLLRTANNDLPALERMYHKLKKDMVLLELEKQKAEQIGSQVRILAKLSEDYKQQIEELHRKKIGLEGLIREFENNEVYKKIIRIAEEEVNNSLSKSGYLLKLAVASVIESIVRDPDRYNFLVNSNIYTGKQHSASHPYISIYRTLILDEAQQLFELIVRDLTSRFINETVLTIPSQT